MAEIKTSLDWATIEAELHQYTSGLYARHDFLTMTKNISRMVKKLGELELEHRRSNGHDLKSPRVFWQVAKINEAIHTLELELFTQRLME